MNTVSPIKTSTVMTPAVLKRRITSLVIDMALVAMIYLVLSQVTGSTLMSLGVTTVLAIALHGVVQGETGSSPGKAMTGLKLVNERGRPPGTGPAVIRLAAWIVDGLPCVGVFGILLIWFTPTHQRVGDTITRTFVVSTREDETPADSMAPMGPAPERFSNGDEERQEFDPIWDSKVGSYVQWDPSSKRWMKYDETFSDWVPVEDD